MNKLGHSIFSESTKKSLSILLNSDGFSFSINDLVRKKTISFGKYYFPSRITLPEILLTEVLRIFANDKELQQDFVSIQVIHQNELSTVVPNEYFDKHNLKKYLDFNIKTLPNDYITFDNFITVDAKNVYVPFVNVNNYLLQNFGEFEFKHHSTVLIDKLLEYSKNTISKSFFVYVTSSNIDVVVLHNSDLVFYNTFTYTTEVDFVYYILFVAEQLELDPEIFKLIFLGDISEEQANYQLTYKYVRNISFLESDSTFFDTSEEFLNHSNYLIVS